MLQELSNQQLEQALAHLVNPLPQSPPEPLSKLTQVEWYLLEQLLSNLLLEKGCNPLQ